MSGLIIPGHSEPAAKVGICNFCGARFERAGEEQVWQKHTVECGQKHLDEIRAMSPSAQRAGTVFDPEQWDPEVEEHMKKVGERMKREGRLEVHKSERAGF